MGDDGWGGSGDGGWGNTDGGFGGGGGETNGNSGGFGEANGNDGGFGGGGGGRKGGERRSYRDNGGGQFGGGRDGGGGGFGGASDRKRPHEAENGGEGEEERPPPFRPEEVDLEQEEQLKIDQGINFDRYDRINVDVRGGTITPITEFKESITSQLLLDNIARAGYKKLTPVQKYTIPALTQGHDIVGCAQTGSGKTAAFLLPVLQTILNEPNLDSQYGQECQKPYCIVIAPTRELAKQTYVEALKLSRDSVVKCQYIYGGVQTGFLRGSLSKGCHILVATPGRLKDFIGRNWISLEQVKYVILDEGDRLIDQGFVVDMRVLFTHESMPPKSDRQTMFFSATFKDEAQAIAKEFMKPNYLFITVGMVGAANEDVKQEFMQVERSEKKRELKKLLQGMSPSEKVIVFTQTKATADIIASFLTSSGIDCTSIHGDRHQSQREQALNEFKRGTKRCLVASPVGERGLDLPKVSMVINYDMPNELDEYIHRIGRTGRIGNTGRALSFFDPDRDARLISDLKRTLEQAQQEVPDFFSGASAGYNDNPGGFEDQLNGGSTTDGDDSAPVAEEAW